MLRALEIALMSLLFAAIATGCSSAATDDEPEAMRGTRDGDDSRRRAPSRAEPTAGYETISVVNGGTISGAITWTGEQPDPIDVPVPIHAERCGETQRSPVLSIGRRSGVANTVVWLDAIPRGRALAIPEEPISVGIEDCAFRPHVVAAPVGARIELRNAEPILHNVHARFVDRAGGMRTWFSEGLPEAGATHVATLERPGVVRLVDDAGHPWMHAWVHVFDHPYFAVSDAAGRFQLTGIPPGQYVVRAWHEGFLVSGATESGRPVYSAPIVLSRPVTLSSGHDTRIDFVIGTASAEAAGD